MKYIRVLWKHQNPDYPIVIVSEIDIDQWEHRKVEIWADGRKGHSDKSIEAGGTGLGLEPWPDLDKIATDPEFEIQFITQEMFEEIWEKRNVS